LLLDETAIELEEIAIELDELDLLLDELSLLLDEDVATELDETPQALTTPKGAGCAAQVEFAIQLFPFS
jgi:hypothetical protein